VAPATSGLYYFNYLDADLTFDEYFGASADKLFAVKKAYDAGNYIQGWQGMPKYTPIRGDAPPPAVADEPPTAPSATPSSSPKPGPVPGPAPGTSPSPSPAPGPNKGGNSTSGAAVAASAPLASALLGALAMLLLLAL
jgi:hypothetical protein